MKDMHQPRDSDTSDDMEGRLLNLKWNSHGAEFVTLLDEFRRKGLYTDATLACEDCVFHVHTVVLSVCSPFFAKIFHNTYCQSPIVVLQDISAKQMEDLLIYMYCGEVRVHKDELPSLLKIAESLQIKGLVSSHPTDTAVVTSATEEQIARWGIKHVEGVRSQFKSDVDIRSKIEKGYERQVLPSHYSYPMHYHYQGTIPTSSGVSLDTRERIQIPMSPKSKASIQSSEEVASSSSPSQDRPIDYHFSRSRSTPTSSSVSKGLPVSHISKGPSLQSTAEEVASSSSPQQERPHSLPYVRRDSIPFQERPTSLPSTPIGHSTSAFHRLVSSPKDVKAEPEERGEYMEESSRMLPARMVTPKPATLFTEDQPISTSVPIVKSHSKSLESEVSPYKSLLSPGSPLPIRSPQFTVTSPRHQILTLDSQYRHSPQLQGEILRPPAGHFSLYPPKSLEITPHPFFSASKDPQKHLREPPPLLKMPTDIRHPFIQPGSMPYPVDMRELQDKSQHSSHLLVKSLPIPPYRPIPSTSLPSPTSSFRFNIHNPQMGPISLAEGMTIYDYPQSSSSSSSLPATLPGTMSDIEGPLNLSGQRSPASTTSTTTTSDHANDPFLGKIITNRRKRLRGPKSWEFLVRLLKDPTTNPSLIRWENEVNGIFRLVQPAVIAQKWGRRTGKHSSECLTYENFARGLRYHYATGALAPVSELSFVYKFGPKAEKLLKELKIEGE